MHARLCLCPPRVVCLFPLLLWESCNQTPLPFKVRWPGNFKSLCQNRRLGSLMWGAELSQSWENFFGIFVLQLPTQWVLDLNSLWLYPSYYLVATSTFSLNVGYHFQCSRVLRLIVVQQLVAVMVQEEANRHPATPPAWNRSLWNTVWSSEMTGELKDTRSASG